MTPNSLDTFPLALALKLLTLKPMSDAPLYDSHIPLLRTLAITDTK